MQAIAGENNLSETAFFLRSGDTYHLRWFTPDVEVPLCGHATLASAYVIFRFLDPSASSLVFSTKSGKLGVRKVGTQLQLDLPARRTLRPIPATEFVPLLNRAPVGAFELIGFETELLVFDREEEVAELEVNFGGLAKRHRSLGVTARGNDCDFVSRYFAPHEGIDRNPVTGSAHCMLVPYLVKNQNRGKRNSKHTKSPNGAVFLSAKIVGIRNLDSRRGCALSDGQHRNIKKTRPPFPKGERRFVSFSLP